MYEDEPVSLPQAATSNNVSGALQQMLLSRTTTPQQQQQNQQNRQQQLGQYQEALRDNPSPGYSALDHGFYSWLNNIGSMRPSVAAIRGAAAGGQFRNNQANLVHQGDVLASKVGYDDAVMEDKQADAELRGLNMGLRSSAASGKPPSPEVLRTVYNAAFNTAAQTAKDGQFSSPDERMAWVRGQANSAVQNYVQNFATQPTGPRGDTPPVSGVQGLEAAPPQMPAPQSAPSGLAPGTLPPQSQQAEAARNMAELLAEMKRPQTANDPERMYVLQQELARAKSVLPQQQQTAELPGGETDEISPTSVQLSQNQPSQPTMRAESTQPPANVLFRNKPAEAAAKKGAEGMAESYVDDYKTVLQAAQSAEAQKQAFDNLAKIKPETNALANTAQTIGSLFSALGQDPSSPLIQNAIKTRDANLIISQLTNAGLRAEKGVQTKSDEVRVANEFPKTTDFQQVWNFSIKLGQERAQRMLDQRDFFDSVAEANNGSPTRARQLWNREMANDPLTQYLGQKLIFRNDFIKAYEAKHPTVTVMENGKMVELSGAEAAKRAWREMEQDYQKRGGKK